MPLILSAIDVVETVASSVVIFSDTAFTFDSTNEQ